MDHLATRGVRRQRGIAAVEFAICLPLLLFLLLVTADLGRLLSQYDTLTKSTRDAARYIAAKAAAGSQGVLLINAGDVLAAENLAVYGNINGTGTPLLPGLKAGNFTIIDAGNLYVSVTAAYTYSPMLGSSIPTFGITSKPLSLGFTLNTIVTLRAL
jgi:Flp pilus assembly protein TadG